MKDSNPIITLTIATICLAGASVIIFGFPSLTPVLLTKFKVVKAQVGLFTSAVFLGNMVSLLLFSWLPDLWGGRKAAVFSLTIIAVSTGMMAYSSGFEAMLFLLFVAGISWGLLVTAMTRGISVWFQSEKRGMAIGVSYAGINAGSAAGSIVLPVLVTSFDWYFALLSAAFPIAAIVVLGGILYKDPPRDPSAASLTLAATLNGYWKLIKHRSLLLLAFVGFIFQLAQSAFVSFLSLYITEFFALSIVFAGTILGVTHLTGGVARIVWGILSDRFFRDRRQYCLAVIGFISSLTYAVMAFMSPAAPVWSIVAVSTILGFTIVGWSALFMTLGTEIAGDELSGSASGLALGLGMPGYILGSYLFGVILDRYGSFSIPWLFLAIAMGIATFMSIQLKKGQEISLAAAG